MMFLILRKPRAPWSLLRALISRRQYFKRDVETATCPVERTDKRDEAPVNIDTQAPKTAQVPDIHVTHTLKRDTRCPSDTDAIVNQLADLAATVSQSTHSPTTQSKRSSSSSDPRTTITQSGLGVKEEEGEESFHYLRSLITVSCLPQQPPEHNLSHSITGEKEIQATGRKRASSRLSLRLGDLPGLSFPPKVSRKPCPRYTPLPPLWTPKPVAVRPEVRF